MKEPNIKNIFVGVSGGVDSSVTAALLKQQGHNVTGVFIRTWQPDWIECTWREEKRDAIRVCAHLDIPFVELNLEKEYKEGVADYMISEYKKGRTPNPDVMCNKEVKFGGFLKWARDNGADYVATGHYAQITTLKNNRVELSRGIDESKDQSYFLWTLEQKQLQHILLPLGGFKKTKVRKLARKFGLPTSDKKDSQGICFIGEIDMKEFLSHYIEEKQGEIVDQKGTVIGSHRGSLFYTIGERHGLTINDSTKSTSDKPYYVISKNIDKNQLVVSTDLKNSEDSKDKKIELINLVDNQSRMRVGEVYEAQVRYHGEIKTIKILDINNDTLCIELEKPDLEIAKGQSVVIYIKNICLGGAVVK